MPNPLTPPFEIHRCVVLLLKPGRVAIFRLPSGEHLMLSIGYSTVKVFAKRWLVGWVMAKRLLSQEISAWQPDLHQLNCVYQKLSRGMILMGLLEQICQLGSIAEVQKAWGKLKNPLVATLTDVRRSWGESK